MTTTDSTMRAAVLIAEGGTDAIAVQQVPIPSIPSGHVRVRVSHAALNRLDIWIRRGMPSVDKPRVMGADGAGTLEAIGDATPEQTASLRGLKIGDQVLIDPGMSCGKCEFCARGETSLCDHFAVLGEHTAGTHAEYVVVPAENVHAIPEHLTIEQAAALTLTFATAWRMLFSRAKVLRDETVLVWGASSGVGCAALQICAAAGIETVATTRTDDKVAALRKLGANHVIVTGSDDDASQRVVSYVRKNLSSGSVDVAFDHLGAIAWGASMAALRKGGRYVTCGVTTGANPPANIARLFWKQLDMLGSTMASKHDVRDMLTFVGEHQISPSVDSTFALENIAAAHDQLEHNEHVGKVVLTL